MAYFPRLNSNLRLLSRSCFTRCVHQENKIFDVVFVGGGVMAMSSAYFLAQRIDPSSICVIERDYQYLLNSAVRSWGSIRQQFSVAENIQMSQFGFHFMENADEYLGIEGEDPVDVQLKNGTYCFLASESGKQALEENAKVQRAQGVPISLLVQDEIAKKYPWLNTDGIGMASNVSFGEGWIDPWLFLCHLKKKVADMGVKLVEGEVVAINTDKNGQISGVKLAKNNDSPNPERLKCGHLVNTAGAWAEPVSLMLGIDLPVRASKRVTYVVQCPDGFEDAVLLIDTACSIAIRPESGKQYIVCYEPEEEGKDTHDEDLDIDHEYFDTEIWPKLAYRIPAFEKLKVTNAWAGFYEYNILDQNGIISAHPEVKNFFFANGFSGHGLQQSPAVGRAISELILDGRFQTIDLSRYSYDRFHNNRLIIEHNVI